MEDYDEFGILNCWFADNVKFNATIIHGHPMQLRPEADRFTCGSNHCQHMRPTDLVASR